MYKNFFIIAIMLLATSTAYSGEKRASRRLKQEAPEYTADALDNIIKHKNKTSGLTEADSKLREKLAIIPTIRASYRGDELTTALVPHHSNIIQYYTTIDTQTDTTAHEREVATVCKKALRYFKQQANLGFINPAVIFDVDETVLSNFAFGIETGFSASNGTEAIKIFREQKRCTAIKPMLKLCTQLSELGYTICFISSRRGIQTEETRQNLLEQGFPVYELELMPMDLYRAKMPIQAWKESVRKTLTDRGYSIIGNLGDKKDDLAGEHSGKTFLVPGNYLY